MTEEQINQFSQRIDTLGLQHKPLFGQMNVNQMLCHCADFFRMAKGEKRPEEYGQINADEIKALVKSGKSAPTPKGFGQVEGKGTKPTNIENDKKILKKFILEFSKLPQEYHFATHPYFGDMDFKRWNSLAIYHLNHHLTQFDV